MTGTSNFLSKNKFQQFCVHFCSRQKSWYPFLTWAVLTSSSLNQFQTYLPATPAVQRKDRNLFRMCPGSEAALSVFGIDAMVIVFIDDEKEDC